MLSVVDLGIVHRVEVAPRTAPSGSRSCRPSSAARRSSSSSRRSRPASPPSGARSTVSATFEVPWTSERITEAGRAALLAAGIAPPTHDDTTANGPGALIDLEPRVPCPHCGSRRTVLENVFGPTQCRTIRYCATAASRSKPSSPSDRGRAGSSRPGRRRRGRDHGRRDRPARARSGHEVWIHDVDAAAIERGRAGSGAAWSDARAARPRSGLGRAWVEARLSRLRERRPLDDLTDAGPGLVIEAALEDLAAKRAIFRALDAGTRARRSSRPTRVRCRSRRSPRATRQPDRVLGLHFFNPAPVMPLVEVVATAARSGGRRPGDGAMIAWGKVPVRCADTPGFIVNRVNRPFTLEALAMLDGGRRAGRLDRRGDSRRRLPDGPIRAHGPRRHRHQPRRRARHLRGRSRQVIRSPSVSVRRRSRSGSSPTAGSGGRRSRASTCYDDGRARPDRTGRRPSTPTGRPATMRLDVAGDRRERITLAVVNEAYRAAGEGVATPPTSTSRCAWAPATRRAVRAGTRARWTGAVAAALRRLEPMAPASNRRRPSRHRPEVRVIRDSQADSGPCHVRPVPALGVLTRRRASLRPVVSRRPTVQRRCVGIGDRHAVARADTDANPIDRGRRRGRPPRRARRQTQSRRRPSRSPCDPADGGDAPRSRRWSHPIQLTDGAVRDGWTCASSSSRRARPPCEASGVPIERHGPGDRFPPDDLASPRARWRSASAGWTIARWSTCGSTPPVIRPRPSAHRAKVVQVRVGRRDVAGEPPSRGSPGDTWSAR